MTNDTVNLAKQVLSQEQHGARDQPALRAFLKKQPTIDLAKSQGLKRGGTSKAHPASIIPGVHIVGHNPIFHGDE